MLIDQYQTTIYDIIQSLYESKFLLDERIYNCGNSFYTKDFIGNRDGIRTYGSRCNLKICPYCRTFISDEHTKKRYRTYFEHIEHNQNIINFKKKSDSRKMIMITLSIKTVRDDKLFYLMNILKSCWEELYKSELWRNIKNDYERLFLWKQIELKTKIRDFSPHIHVVIGLNNIKESINSIQKKLLKKWIQITNQYGRKSTHGVHIKEVDKGIINYLDNKFEFDRNEFDNSSLDSITLNYIEKWCEKNLIEKYIDDTDLHGYVLSPKMKEMIKRNKQKNIIKLSNYITYSEFNINKKKGYGYSTGMLEYLNHFYLNYKNFSYPNISHGVVKGRLKQIYSVFGKPNMNIYTSKIDNI